MIRPLREPRALWPELARAALGILAFVVISTLVLTLAAWCEGCSGAPFEVAPPLAADAGGESVQSAPIDDAGDAGLLAVDAGQDAITSVQIDATSGADVEAGEPSAPLIDAAAADVAAPPQPHDAGAEAAADAGDPTAGYCCRIACGTGTIRTGFTCAGGTCTVGGSCTYATACGLVIACP